MILAAALVESVERAETQSDAGSNSGPLCTSRGGLEQVTSPSLPGLIYKAENKGDGQYFVI